MPVKATEALEQFDDFEPYTNEPSKEFLQFAAKYLSFNRSDPQNNPVFKSCLIRVPYTFNSKCLEQKIDPEVKIIHQWDGPQQKRPEIDNLLIDFQTFLADRKLKVESNKTKMRNDINNCPNTTNTIP